MSLHAELADSLIHARPNDRLVRLSGDDIGYLVGQVIESLVGIADVFQSYVAACGAVEHDHHDEGARLRRDDLMEQLRAEMPDALYLEREDARRLRSSLRDVEVAARLAANRRLREARQVVPR